MAEKKAPKKAAPKAGPTFVGQVTSYTTLAPEERAGKKYDRMAVTLVVSKEIEEGAVVEVLGKEYGKDKGKPSSRKASDPITDKDLFTYADDGSREAKTFTLKEKAPQ